MIATRSFGISPPTAKDLDVAERAWRNGTLVHDVPAETRFWRALSAPAPSDAIRYAKVCYPSDAPNRFTPINTGRRIVPAAYAGSTREVALWEIVLRDIRHEGVKRVPSHRVRNRYLVETRTRRRMKLLDIRRPKDANLVAGRRRPPKLSAAPKSAYLVTRQWATALYARLRRMDGIVYESHQVPGDCILLLQPGTREVFEIVGDAQAVAEEPIRTMLRCEAGKAGAVVDFGHLPDP